MYPPSFLFFKVDCAKQELANVNIFAVCSYLLSGDLKINK